MRSASTASWRGKAGVLASVCAIAATILTGGPALADDPTPTSEMPTPTESPSESAIADPSTSPTESSTTNTLLVSPTIVLNISEGAPGAPFTATAFDFSCGKIAFLWDRTPIDIHDVVESTSGGVAAYLNVPTGADPGVHQVSAACGRQMSPPVGFTVDFQPALTLDPQNGDQSAPVTATATHFNCDTVNFAWDDTISLGSARVGSGTASMSFTVPDGAAVGAHHVTASCGDQAAPPAPFTVPPQPALHLLPGQGAPGTQFTAVTTGLETCSEPVSYRWDDEPLQPLPAGDDGAVTFEVPRDATHPEYTVTASCGRKEVTSPFTLIATSKPILSLGVGHGEAGSTLEATGTGFDCATGRVQLSWDDAAPPLTDASSGTFNVQFGVPGSATEGGHTVTASCTDDPGISDTQRFTVTSAPPAVVTAPPALTLRPSSGHPGDRVQASGDRFGCASGSGPVELSWDDGTSLPAATLESGHFTAALDVPAGTDARRLTLSASCADGVILAADFTLLAAPPPPPPESGIPWWTFVLVALVVLGAVLLAVKLLRPKRKPKPLPHVDAVARPDGLLLVTLQETPDRGESTHALALRTLADIGTVTLER